MGKLKNILSIHKDIEKKKQDELMERGRKFKQEYDALSRKYQMDWTAELQYAPDGIRPIFKLKPLETPKMKLWSEAKQDNLDQRIACTHKNTLGKALNDEEVQNAQCVQCNLKVRFWGAPERLEDGSSTVNMVGKGVTPEYKQRKEAEIAMVKASEKEETDDEITGEDGDYEEGDNKQSEKSE